MRFNREQGTSITEYGFLMALLVIAALGATSVMGNSLANLHKSVSDKIALAGSGETAGSAQGKSDSGGPKGVSALLGWSQDKLSQYRDEVNDLKTTKTADGQEVPYFELPKTSSNGINSTGSEGDTVFGKSYAQAIQVANQLLEAAAKTQDESLKQWYMDTALQTVKLAKNQAAFEYNKDTSNQALVDFAGTMLSNQDATSSMKGWVSHLYGQQEQLEMLKSRVSPSEFQTAKDLVYSVTDSTREYYQLASSSAAEQVVYDPQVSDIRQEATNAIMSGVGGMALDFSLLGSIDMVNRADAQP